MIEVSIIIPNYNHGLFLKQRIDSVLEQTFQNFELIILDDKSTDNSLSIIEKYRNNPKISHILINEVNSGSTFKQWEKGINIAIGKYIWIAESDDWCEPTLLQHLFQGMQSDPDCSVSYCQSYCINENDDIKWLSQHHKLSEIVDGNAFIRQKLLLGNAIFNASMALWKRELYKSVTTEFTEYKFCGDWLFWISLSTLGKVHISGRVLNYFRKHGNDVSNKAYKSGLNFFEELRVLDHLYKTELIELNEYKKAYHLKNKQYKLARPDFKKETQLAIDKLFASPINKSASLFKQALAKLGV